MYSLLKTRINFVFFVKIFAQIQKNRPYKKYKLEYWIHTCGIFLEDA